MVHQKLKQFWIYLWYVNSHLNFSNSSWNTITWFWVCSNNFSKYNLSTKSLLNNDTSLSILDYFFNVCCLFRIITHHTKCYKEEVQIQIQISLFSKLFADKLYCVKWSEQTHKQKIFHKCLLKFMSELS